VQTLLQMCRATVVLAMMSAHLLVVAHYSKAVAVVAVQELPQVLAVQALVGMVQLQVVAHQQVLTRHQAVAVMVKQQSQAVLAVLELFM